MAYSRATRLRDVLLATVGLSLLLVAIHNRASPIRSGASAHGRFSESEIIARARAFCSVIGTQTTGAHWTGTPQRVWPHAGAMMSIWIVECYDSSGGSLVSSRWDANTGELIQISLPEVRPLFATAKPLDVQQLRRAERYWVRVVSLGDARQWKLVRGPLKRYDGWWAYWQAGGRTAAILIDAKHGGLRYAFLETMSGTPSS